MIKNQQKKIDACNDKILKRKIVKYYKKGNCLGKISRKYHLDISTILLILKTSKIRKIQLYKIHDKQYILNEKRLFDIILKSDEYYINKFFPNNDSDSFTTSYYYYWKENNEKAEQKKKECKHTVRHIRCSTCNKILCDASNISILKRSENQH